MILPNETATFECSVVGFGILNVNGRVLSESIDEFTSKGFRYSVEELSDGLQTFTSMKLSVKGVPSNNGSRIDCYGYSDNVIYFSSLLIIAGDFFFVVFWRGGAAFRLHACQIFPCM